MSFNERFEDRFRADASSILEDSLERADGLFEYHDDGTVQLSRDVRELGAEKQILVYLIARRLMFEAEIIDSPSLTNEYFYDRLGVSDSSVRNYIKNLRDEGLVRSSSGDHEIVVENLPQAFDIIDDALGISGTEN